MIVTQIDSNRYDKPLPPGTHVELVHLDSAALVKRIQRLRTDHDTELGLRLPAGSPDLRDGDVLHISESGAIVVKVATSDVLVIKARSIVEMAVTAHTLGNRHLPAQFFDADSEFGADVMVVAYDHTVEDYLRSANVPYERVERQLAVPFRHAEHTH